MISATKSRLAPPFDTEQLYWLRLGRDSAGLYSPASFFFASPDGNDLVPAIYDEPRFISALAAAIETVGALPCVSGLQQLLTDLTTASEVPAPRYPQPGDTGVSGAIVWVWPITAFNTPIWVGAIYADIEANGYTTPPANSDTQFQFLFRSTTALENGQAVTFDIARGKFAPLAANVQPA